MLEGRGPRSERPPAGRPLQERRRCPLAAPRPAPASPPHREPLPVGRHRPIVRTHRTPSARPAPAARPQAGPGTGFPEPAAHRTPGPGRGSLGARGAGRPPSSRPRSPLAAVAGPARPRPTARPPPARPGLPWYLPGGRRRRLLSLRGLRAAAERRAALACALRKAAAAPAPLAEGGRRRAAAAPLRYPATGLSAPPTGRAPYPSAQAPGLHQRRRPAPPRRRPAPPAGPGLGARQLGGLGARVPLVCAASERGHPYGGARGCCSWQKPLNSAASWPPPGQWSSACSPFPGKCSSRLCPLVAASWDGWSGRFKIKT